MIKKLITKYLLLLLIGTASIGIASADSNSSKAKPTNPVIRLATTTSTENSGLTRAIFPVFEEQTGYRLQVISVGTGKAMRMARDGDVDAILVHARSAEEEFVAKGYGVKRHPVMYNDFIIIGPKKDPAGVSKTTTANDALAAIAKQQALFLSRGDDSGTHKKELSLWTQADIKPVGKWYKEAGQGMGRVLQMSGELDAYTMIDRGTWLAHRQKSPLKIVLEGDEMLFNPYGIIAVSPERYLDVNFAGSEALIEWITSEDGQRLIADFQVDGEQLFKPDAGSSLAKDSSLSD